MGIVCSKSHAKIKNNSGSLEDLKLRIFTYLDSTRDEDYYINVRDEFSEIRLYQCNSLQKFIQKIMTSMESPLRAEAYVPRVQPGMWFVVKRNPDTRGKLVKVTQHQEGPSSALIGHMKMDETQTQKATWLVKRLFNLFLSLYLLPLQYLKGNKRKLGEYYMHELELEKNYLHQCHLESSDYKRKRATSKTEVEIHELEQKKIKSTPHDTESQNHIGIEANKQPVSNSLEIEADNNTPSHILPDSHPTLKNEVPISPNHFPNGDGVMISPPHILNEHGSSVEKADQTSMKRSKKRRSKKVEKELTITGSHKGIEGSHNSCYMDSLLFSMFYSTAIFDSILIRKPNDSEFALKTRQVLEKNVVLPLRSPERFCSSENVMQLRSHLRVKNDNIMGSFMDVEELLYILLEDVLKEYGFIRYNNGGEDFMHLMTIDTNDTSPVITCQANFETSLKLNGGLRLKCVPSPALILALPRSDGKLVNYKAVIPNLELDIANVIHPAPCSGCGEDAFWEIYNTNNNIGSPEVLPVCDLCSSTVLSQDPDNYNARSRQKMRLLSIICIRASHFVAFVRDAVSKEWLFFDSMAGGYPEVKRVRRMEYWLNLLEENPAQFERDDIPLAIQRAFTDGHMCIYEPIKLN